VTATPVAAGGNRQAQQDEMFKEIDELGEIEGKGGNAKATLGVKCVEWAAGGTADVGDAYTIYDRYTQRVEDVAAVFGGLKRSKDPEAGRKQNASKVRQFLKMGGLKQIDPVGVIHRAASVVKDERAKGIIAQTPFDALLNIARAQCINTQNELTREEMIKATQPKDKGDVAEADSLGSISHKLEKHENEFGASDEVTEARTQIDARIETLGGTSAEKNRKKRAEEKAAKAAAKAKHVARK